MSLTATIANSFWAVSNFPESRTYRRGLNDVESAQIQLLYTYLKQNSNTAFGQQYQFDKIKDYKQFSKRVPMVNYEALEPWVERIKNGEQRILTEERVTHLVPTSGSSGPRKLIPFTKSLQAEFNRAIAVWTNDLFRNIPGAIHGCAYWSISPAIRSPNELSSVPIGFEDDSAYLGGAQKKLVEAVLAVSSKIRLIENTEIFRYMTLLCLLRREDLSLISIWHPSYLTFLLSGLSGNWNDLIADIGCGSCRYASSFPNEVAQALKLRPLPNRARKLDRLDPTQFSKIWPKLRIISCWGDAAAELPMRDLANHFQDVLIQPKGLLATEAVVTIPYRGKSSLASRSHFFEFVDSKGDILLAHQLRRDEIYEVVVSTSGGLWRYRMHDQVLVTGFLGNTPCFRFIGRIGNVSDVCGEKLSEAFVAQVIQKALMNAGSSIQFALLAPDKDDSVAPGYTLYVEGDCSRIRLEEVDQRLSENPHYSLCRDLGQLRPLRLFRINTDGYETFAAQEIRRGKSLGEIKPSLFSARNDWSEKFDGTYLDQQPCRSMVLT
jgi:hypothetical protein